MLRKRELEERRRAPGHLRERTLYIPHRRERAAVHIDEETSRRVALVVARVVADTKPNAGLPEVPESIGTLVRDEAFRRAVRRRVLDYRADREIALPTT